MNTYCGAHIDTGSDAIEVNSVVVGVVVDATIISKCTTLQSSSNSVIVRINRHS